MSIGNLKEHFSPGNFFSFVFRLSEDSTLSIIGKQFQDICRELTITNFQSCPPDMSRVYPSLYIAAGETICRQIHTYAEGFVYLVLLKRNHIKHMAL